MQLAAHYNTIFVPEYAREHVMRLQGNYTFDDVVFIAKRQVEEYNVYDEDANNILFFDTDMIITKVWFEVVYNESPPWVNEFIRVNHFDYHLLCNTEIPWEPDLARENGGAMRETLFNRYEKELITQGFSYGVITGKGENRLKNAIIMLNKNLK